MRDKREMWERDGGERVEKERRVDRGRRWMGKRRERR